MKKIMLLLMMATLAMIVLPSCTENQRAKQYGGTMTIEIPQGKEFVNATWKNNDLWYLVTASKPGDTRETFYFYEQSDFGVLEGTVIFKEK